MLRSARIISLPSCTSNILPKRFYAFQSNLIIGRVSPTLAVPKHIPRPPFLETPPLAIKTNEQIDRMRNSCILAAKILNFACEVAQAGVTTDELDRATHNEIIKAGAYPSPLLYKGFPKSICTSINECAAHGIPDSRKLQHGDVINIDITVYKDGFHGDTSRTIIVGEKEKIGDDAHFESASNLLKVAHEALLVGINQCKPGASTVQIAEKIEDFVNETGLQVIPGLTGHGIGEYFHELPYISHTRACSPDPYILKENMTFTIEPVIKCKGRSNFVGMLEDEWTLLTADGTLSAIFEHTLRITKDGVEILTLADENATP